DLPPAADLAEQVLARHLDVREEDLVELRVAGDLTKRAHLDARCMHVRDHVREPGVPLGARIAAADEDAVIRDVRVRRPDLLAVDEEVPVLRFDARSRSSTIPARNRL